MNERKKTYRNERGQREKKKRIALIALFFFLGFLTLLYRGVHLHLARDPKLEKIARSQYKAKISSVPQRGNIYDAGGEELAVSVPAYSVASRPRKLKDKEGTARELGEILGLSHQDVMSRLDDSKNYVWIKRHIASRERDHLSEKRRDGIELVKETRRFYPNREVASQILGLVGRDNEGLGGLELYYDRYLQGDRGGETLMRDARGQAYETEESLSMNVKEPHHLYLTLRKNIQYVLEKELAAACSDTHAKACSGIVLDPHTGGILAMGSYPYFNPNSFRSSDLEALRNRAVTDTYEPGSTFKTIAAAAALEAGVVTLKDQFFCENGSLTIGKHVIHDHSRNGMMTFRDIMKVSSNIGIYKVGRKLGKEGLASAIGAFGFGRKTGIDYPGEVAGYVPSVKTWAEVEFANMTFGQGIRITPIQLASSFATIASGGWQFRPYLVSRITTGEGDVVFEERPTPARRILKKETSRLLLESLEEVTREGGTAVEASLPGYRVAGKTGTAQKFVDGKYSHTRFVSSFIGVVPANAPRLVILALVDEPQGVVYGGLVAAPLFRKVAWASMIDLGVPPEQVERPLIQEAGVMNASNPLP